MPAITLVNLDKWLVPQLSEIIEMKMKKGDIQAEFDLNDSTENKSIRVNLKQLFVIVQALIRLQGQIGLEEICYSDSKDDNPFSRDLFITRDGSRIKDITNMGATQTDLMIRDNARVIENQWHKE